MLPKNRLLFATKNGPATGVNLLKQIQTNRDLQQYLSTEGNCFCFEKLEIFLCFPEKNSPATGVSAVGLDVFLMLHVVTYVVSYKLSMMT